MMRNTIKKILKETRDERYYEKVIDMSKNYLKSINLHNLCNVKAVYSPEYNTIICVIFMVNSYIRTERLRYIENNMSNIFHTKFVILSHTVNGYDNKLCLDEDYTMELYGLTLKEELDQDENKKPSMESKVKAIEDEFGMQEAIKIVGGFKNYVKIMFNGDLKKFYSERDYVPYRISDSGMVMYIDDLLIRGLNLDDRGKKEKLLGDFSFKQRGGLSYRFTARVYGPVEGKNGQYFWSVRGTSGDSGFGYSHITQRNTLSKRSRMQIFQQIIDRFNFNQYQ